MPNWTSQTTIKKHIQNVTPPLPNVLNERIVLSGNNNSQLAHTNIDTGTEKVKICELSTPHADTGNPITLNGTTQVVLQKPLLLWDSVVIAADAGLSTIYVEGTDYIIDYTNGKIRRTSGGSIADGGTVHAWYLYFRKFISITDYTLTEASGLIKRSALGNIEDGATVFVDYSHSQTTVTDDIIDQAILEAEAWMVERLSSEYSASSSDQGLKSAATYFSLVIICLSQSFKETIAGRDDSDNLAKRWTELAEKYDHTGVLYFQKFSRAVSVNSGGLIQNRNSGAKYQRQQQSPTIMAKFRKR